MASENVTDHESDGAPLIDAQLISRSFGAVRALHDVSLTFYRG